MQVNVEILGFTTKNGREVIQKALEKNKSIPNPGRLNDLFHIVYKDADTPWKRKVKSWACFKRWNFKENIDGEALIWASRLRRTEKKNFNCDFRRSSVDDATLSTNNSNILDNHLKEVVNEIEKKGDKSSCN